jgi:hypothetical protein
MVKRLILATLSVSLMASPSSPQAPPRCLHGPDERPAHRARRARRAGVYLRPADIP